MHRPKALIWQPLQGSCKQVYITLKPFCIQDLGFSPKLFWWLNKRTFARKHSLLVDRSDEIIHPCPNTSSTKSDSVKPRMYCVRANHSHSGGKGCGSRPQRSSQLVCACSHNTMICAHCGLAEHVPKQFVKLVGCKSDSDVISAPKQPFSPTPFSFCQGARLPNRIPHGSLGVEGHPKLRMPHSSTNNLKYHA